MGTQDIDPSDASTAVSNGDEVDRLRAERDALKDDLDRMRGRKASRGRRIVAALLVILACLVVPITVTAGWTRRTLLNTDRWVDTIAPIVEHRSVTDAMSRRLTEEVMVLIDARSLVEEALPPRAAPLAGPMTNAIHDSVEDQVAELLASERFQEIWVNAHRFSHEQVLSLLRGEGEVITAEDGTIYLNLLPVINEVLVRMESRGQDLLGRDVDLPEIASGEVPEVARQKLEDALGVTVPPDLGEIPIYRSDELESAQDAIRFFDRGVIALLLLSVILVAGALWASTSRRRTLIQLSTGILLGLVLIRRSAMYVQDQAVDIARPENREAARAIVEDLLRGFFSATLTIAIALILIVVICLLTGPYGWAVSLRRRARGVAAAFTAPGDATPDQATVWVRSHREALQLGGALVGIALLFLVELSWPVFLVVAAVVVGYEFLLARMAGGGPAPSG